MMCENPEPHGLSVEDQTALWVDLVRVSETYGRVTSNTRILLARAIESVEAFPVAGHDS